MRSFDATVAIAAAREAVWSVLADVVSWPDWLATVSAVQALDGRPLQVGFRYVLRQPRLRPATWVVTELDPPRRFAWQARSPGLLMTATHDIELDSGGNSRVNLSFAFSGLLGALAGRLFGSVTRQYLLQEAASLKQRVEGGDDKGPA